MLGLSNGASVEIINDFESLPHSINLSLDLALLYMVSLADLMLSDDFSCCYSLALSAAFYLKSGYLPRLAYLETRIQDNNPIIQQYLKFSSFAFSMEGKSC